MQAANESTSQSSESANGDVQSDINMDRIFTRTCESNAQESEALVDDEVKLEEQKKQDNKSDISK